MSAAAVVAVKQLPATLPWNLRAELSISPCRALFNNQAHNTWQDAQCAIETMAAHATRCTKALQACSCDSLDLAVSHHQPRTARLHRERQWRKVASTCDMNTCFADVC